MHKFIKNPNSRCPYAPFFFYVCPHLNALRKYDRTGRRILRGIDFAYNGEKLPDAFYGVYSRLSAYNRYAVIGIGRTGPSVLRLNFGGVVDGENTLLGYLVETRSLHVGYVRGIRTCR